MLFTIFKSFCSGKFKLVQKEVFVLNVKNHKSCLNCGPTTNVRIFWMVQGKRKGEFDVFLWVNLVAICFPKGRKFAFNSKHTSLTGPGAKFSIPQRGHETQLFLFQGGVGMEIYLFVTNSRYGVDEFFVCSLGHVKYSG